jgi:hypothetical protein
MDTENPLDGLVLPSGNAADSSVNPSADSTSASQNVIKERKKRSDAGTARGVRGSTNANSIQTLSQAQFAQLYDPKIWAKALAAPADAMQAIGKHPEIWKVSDNEREALGATGAIAAQCFAVSDPRWLAISLALITLIDVYGIRIAKEIAQNNIEKAQKEKQKTQ